MKLLLSILTLGMLIAVGAAFDERDSYGPSHDGDRHDHHDHNDFGGHVYHDWLSPGAVYSYSYWYPSYTYSWYPTYTYTYPTYYYTAPVVYPTYTYYYDPVVYDPWYAANVYGWGGATYYYSSSWSWSSRGGYYFA